jgi:hypothetical protein
VDEPGFSFFFINPDLKIGAKDRAMLQFWFNIFAGF